VKPGSGNTRKESIVTESSTGTQLTERYGAAVELARTLHAADVRKGTTTPYFAHLLSVSALVLEHGGSEDQAIAGLLHDAAEDHGGQATVDEIRTRFGDVVADIVAACSDSLTVDPTAKAPWWDRKVAYLDQLRHEPAPAVLVSAADKLHNARAILGDYRRIGDTLWKRFNPDAGMAGSLWYYTRLVEVLGERLAGRGPEAAALAAELAGTVRQLIDLIAVTEPDVHEQLSAATRREAGIREAAAFRL
jgi:(p)ppGpp synthase/HD superfamily hydrolase